MARCEDYPCCGHGPAPWGDGGGCPEVDEDTGARRWRCVLCSALMPAGASSSICDDCREGGVHDADDPGCGCRRCQLADIDAEADECDECGGLIYDGEPFTASLLTGAMICRACANAERGEGDGL